MKHLQELHAHSVQFVHKLTATRRAIENKNTLLNTGALEQCAARNPTDPHEFPLIFWESFLCLHSQQQHGTSTCKATFGYNQQLCRKKEGMVDQQGLLVLLACQDMAVPLGRNNAPPETPSTTVLEGMVESHIKKFNAGASPGLDGIPAPFLQHACLPIECGRKVDYVKVLVPLIAHMFRVFFSEARIPACWKVAKLGPLYKKLCQILGTTELIAASGVMYRTYAIVLKNLVTDWCIQKNKVPDTQFGFYPGRSTLHPLFILRHLRHAAIELKPQQSPRLHAAFMDFMAPALTSSLEDPSTRHRTVSLNLLNNQIAHLKNLSVDFSRKVKEPISM
eukprot:1136771-Pelagomonas_calceolata.AAC.2